tara:strand:- start:105 stop:536 length:432 start_codon:yes stop_codon:yes gene_type:complete
MYYILYTSEASENCSEKEISEILKISRKNNQTNSVTGILVYKKPYFLQYLEGPEKTVTSLYEKIKLDDRHIAIKTVNRKKTNERIFPNWEMGFAGEEDLQPLRWKWGLDKLTLFSLAHELDDCMDEIKAFISIKTLGQNFPTN